MKEIQDKGTKINDSRKGNIGDSRKDLWKRINFLKHFFLLFKPSQQSCYSMKFYNDIS